MIRLTKSLSMWKTPAFNDALTQELEHLAPDVLPLQQGLSTGSYASDTNVKVVILSISEGTEGIHAKVGVFYTGIIAGCSCADDPTPVDENPEYCEVQLDIDKQTAETTITLLNS